MKKRQLTIEIISFHFDFEVSTVKGITLLEFSWLDSPVHSTEEYFFSIRRTTERVNEGDNTWILFSSAKFAHSPIIYFFRDNRSFCQTSKTRTWLHPKKKKEKHMQFDWKRDNPMSSSDFTVVNLAQSDTVNYVICFFLRSVRFFSYYFCLFCRWK